MDISHELTKNISIIINDLANKLKDPEQVESNVISPENVSLIGGHPWDPLSLSHGFPGTIMFFSEMSRVYPKENWDYIAHDHILNVSKYIQNGVRSISLFGGATGLAYAIYIASRGGKRYKSFLTNLDHFILEETSQILKQREKYEGVGASPAFYDVIEGFSGIGRYFLERAPQDNDFKKMLQSILASFISMCLPLKWDEKNIPGWYVSKENQFLEKDKTIYPNGNFNLGLAHGILAPLSLMSMCTLKGIEVPGQRDTIKYIGDWLLKHMQYDSNGFPIWPHRVSLEEELGKEHAPYNSREGWCYGNPGVARVLYLSGKAINQTEYQRISIDGFIGITKRSKEQINLISPTFCHGKAGLLQILLRMQMDTGTLQLDTLINELVNDMMKSFNPHSPLGFKDIEILGGERNEINKAGLLEGCTGSGLALLSLISIQKPIWDSVFLIA